MKKKSTKPKRSRVTKQSLAALALATEQEANRLLRREVDLAERNLDEAQRELASLRADHDSSESWWMPQRVMIGQNLVSEVGDHRLTMSNVHAGQDINLGQCHAVTKKPRMVRVEYLRLMPGPCKAFCSNGRLLFLLYERDLSIFSRLAVALLEPLFKSIGSSGSLFE